MTLPIPNPVYNTTDSSINPANFNIWYERVAVALETIATNSTTVATNSTTIAAKQTLMATSTSTIADNSTTIAAQQTLIATSTGTIAVKQTTLATDFHSIISTNGDGLKTIGPFDWIYGATSVDFDLNSTTSQYITKLKNISVTLPRFYQ